MEFIWKYNGSVFNNSVEHRVIHECLYETVAVAVVVVTDVYITVCRCSESVDGSTEDFDDLDFGCELDQSGDDAAMSYEDDQ